MDEQSPKKKATPLVPGLYAKDLIFPWEDREEFVNLHNGLKDELFPNGTCEEECVLDLASQHWLKHSLSRLRIATVLRNPFTDEILATEAKSWTGIRRGLRESAREDHTLRKTIEKALAKSVRHMLQLTEKIALGGPEELKKYTPILETATKLFEKSLLPLQELVRQLPDAEGAFDKNYGPEGLERVVRLEALIDARINKALARLVGLKEFKRTPAGSRLAQLTAT